MRIFIFILISLNLFSSEIKLEYRVKFGVFGDVGVANAKIKKDKKNYSIELEARTEDTLAFLTKNRVEKYQSFGEINNTILTPDFYIKSRKNNYKSKKDTYRFDHKNSIVNIDKYRKKYEKEENSEANSTFYSKNDILTLLFNLNSVLSKEKLDYNFTAIGANKKNGKIDLSIKKWDKNGLNLNVIIMGKKDLDKKNLLITLDKDFIPVKVLLKDMDFFGDIEANLKQKVIH